MAEYETQVKGKTFQSPSDVFMQHNPERFSVKSVLTLLRAVFDLTWRNASHFFSVTLTSPILPGVKDRLAFAFHQPFEKVVIVQTWRITFCVYK